MSQEGHDIWTYKRVASSASELSQGMATTNISPGDHVILLAENSPEWIVACIAILQAGAVPVPLDAQYDAETVRHIISDISPTLVFTSTSSLKRFAPQDKEMADSLVLLDKTRGRDYLSWRDLCSTPEASVPPASKPSPDSRAVVFYTSGTTGKPKGVPLTQRNIAFEIQTILDSGIATARDRVLLPLPLHHVYPFVMGMLVPLSLGIPIILPHALTGPGILRSIHDGQATVLVAVPRLYRALVDGVERRIDSRGRFHAAGFHALLTVSRLLKRYLHIRIGKTVFRPLHKQTGRQVRLMASGGAPMDPALAWTMEALGWQVVIGYGLTETAPLLTLLAPPETAFRSVGRAIPGVDLRVAQKSGRDTADKAGEVLARGPNVFHQYHGLPDETTSAFTEDGWFKTGDRGFFDRRGYLHLRGRVSTMIVTEAGENLQPEDVEARHEQHPVIKEIGVLQAEKGLAAVVVPEPEALTKHSTANPNDVVGNAMHELSQQLPTYQRIGNFVISREPLDRTRLGKLRRHLLEERFHALKGNGKSRKGRQRPVAKEEMSLEDQERLKSRNASVVWDIFARRYRNYPLTMGTSLQLDLGIDSLEWVSLTLEVRQQTGIDISEDTIAHVNTVRELLDEVSQASTVSRQSSEMELRETPEDLIDPEQRHWLEPISAWQRGEAYVLFAVVRVLLRTLFSLQVRHRERLAGLDQYILIPNHTSYLDPFVVAAAIGFPDLHRVHWAGLTQAAFNTPFRRWLSRLAQAVPVDPMRGAVSGLASGATILKRGHSLVWFPEGGRSPSGELQSFKPGIGILARHFDVPLVPVAIHGTFRAMPIGQRIPRPGRVTVSFGTPVSSKNVRGTEGDKDSDKHIAQTLRGYVAELLQADK